MCKIGNVSTDTAPNLQADIETVPRWELHHRLARALEFSGVTPDAMARELGVHVNTVHNYAAGRRAPLRSVVKDWAEVCGVSRRWLLGEEPDDGGSPPVSSQPARRSSGRAGHTLKRNRGIPAYVGHPTYLPEAA